MHAMVAASLAPDINQQTINVGSGVETSVRELVDLVQSVTGSKPEVMYNPRNDRGPAHMCADISLAKEKLGYTPKTSLESGLKLTFERDKRLQNHNHK